MVCVNASVFHINRTSKNSRKKDLLCGCSRIAEQMSESTTIGKHFQIRGSTGLLRCVVDTILHLRGMDEVTPKMRNVLKELYFEAQPDMVEENQVLMQLSHVTNVRHHGKTEDPREKTDSKELADTPNSRAIDLNERQRLGLHEVLEQNTVCDMLTGSDLHWAHRT